MRAGSRRSVLSRRPVMRRVTSHQSLQSSVVMMSTHELSSWHVAFGSVTMRPTRPHHLTAMNCGPPRSFRTNERLLASTPLTLQPPPSLSWRRSPGSCAPKGPVKADDRALVTSQHNRFASHVPEKTWAESAPRHGPAEKLGHKDKPCSQARSASQPFVRARVTPPEGGRPLRRDPLAPRRGSRETIVAAPDLTRPGQVGLRSPSVRSPRHP